MTESTNGWMSNWVHEGVDKLISGFENSWNGGEWNITRMGVPISRKVRAGVSELVDL